MPIDWDKAVEEAAGLAKRQILEDIASGRVPSTVTTFRELHDYVDANEYGGLTRDKPWVTDGGSVTAGGFDHADAVQFVVDRWLRNGRKDSPMRTFLVLGHGDALDAAVEQLGDELREKKLRTMLTADETRFLYELDKAVTRAAVLARHPAEEGVDG